VPSSRTNRADLVKLNLLTVKNGSKQMLNTPPIPRGIVKTRFFCELKLFYAVLNDADIKR